MIPASCRDRIGKPIFCDGPTGYAHALAHEALDAGRPTEGYWALRTYLRSHQGTGPRWAHLHWHMAVFELALGRWQDAWDRYEAHIAPHLDEATTDAPSLLWRLKLAAPDPAALPWGPVRDAALAHEAHHPFVAVHVLLALAGAGDTDGLAARLAESPATLEAHLVRELGRGLLAGAEGRCAEAVARFDGVLPHLPRLGGSHGQNGLFQQIRDQAAAGCPHAMAA